MVYDFVVRFDEAKLRLLSNRGHPDFGSGPEQYHKAKTVAAPSLGYVSFQEFSVCSQKNPIVAAHAYL